MRSRRFAQVPHVVFDVPGGIIIPWNSTIDRKPGCGRVSHHMPLEVTLTPSVHTRNPTPGSSTPVTVNRVTANSAFLCAVCVSPAAAASSALPPPKQNPMSAREVGLNSDLAKAALALMSLARVSWRKDHYQGRETFAQALRRPGLVARVDLSSVVDASGLACPATARAFDGAKIWVRHEHKGLLLRGHGHEALPFSGSRRVETCDDDVATYAWDKYTLQQQPPPRPDTAGS